MNHKINSYLIFVLVLTMIIPVFHSHNSWAEGKTKPPPSKPLKKVAINPKIETVLQVLANKRQEGISVARRFAQQKGIPLVNDNVKVIIEPQGNKSVNIDRGKLETFGAQVEATSQSLTRARIPIGRLLQVANEVSGISFIRLSYPHKAVKVDTSEGVSKTGATNYHNASYYGQNVKVAIIDLGFDHLTEAKSSDDLPASVIAYDNDYTADDDIEAGTNHGTDVAEIVHDMAPQADLYLMKIGDSVDLENAKDDAISMGVDVINHSVGWYNSAYYDGTGTISDIASNARDNGILWVNAAGNEAKNHWQGNFLDTDGFDTDGYRWHEFNGGDECNQIGSIGSGNTIYIWMTWNAWPDDPEDYDLYLFDSSGTTVDSSLNYQTETQPPYGVYILQRIELRYILLWYL